MARPRNTEIAQAFAASTETAQAPAVDKVVNMVTVSYNSPQSMIFPVKGKEIRINGNAEHLRGKEKGVIPIGRFGYTRIEEADWEAIVAVYGSMSIFKNGLIFAEKSKSRAEDRADEQAEFRHGREPVTEEEMRTKESSKPGEIY